MFAKQIFNTSKKTLQCAKFCHHSSSAKELEFLQKCKKISTSSLSDNSCRSFIVNNVYKSNVDKKSSTGCLKQCKNSDNFIDGSYKQILSHQNSDKDIG